MVNRVNNASFAPKVEGSFSKIERIGNSPTSYYWIVTDKSGTKYYYGQSANSRFASSQGNIAKWMLTKVEDKNGNFMTYNYITKTYNEGNLAGGKEILISSNMGMSFGTLVVFAMISGFFIIGLTLYSSALDRIKDYGTLKAIGANKKYVNRLLITQAFLYALIGFGIAFLLLLGFAQGVKNSGLEIDFSLAFISFLLGITLFISIGGSLFAVRKISKLEPASVF